MTFIEKLEGEIKLEDNPTVKKINWEKTFHPLLFKKPIGKLSEFSYMDLLHH